MSELRTNRIVPRDGLVSGTGIGGGIIQVKNATITATDTISCANASALAYYDSILLCSITPTRADSKILVSLSATGEGNAANQELFQFRIKRVISGGATTFIQGAAAGDRSLALGNTGDLTDSASGTPSSFSINNYLDTPATTSAVTYTMQISYYYGYGAGTYYLNRNASDSDANSNGRFVSWMTLMEVSG